MPESAAFLSGRYKSSLSVIGYSRHGPRWGFGIAHFYSIGHASSSLQWQSILHRLLVLLMSLVPQPLLLGPIPESEISLTLPPLLQPLMRAAQRGEDVAPIALAIANTFGFDGFWYGVSLSLQPSQESMIYVYSTWPESLTQLYDQQAYVEIDPRIQQALASVVPVVWDQASYRGRSPQVEEFLDVMQDHGIASGLMCSLRDLYNRVAALTMSSRVPILDEVRRLNISTRIGDILNFQRYFHELFVRGVMNRSVPPYRQGKQLTLRELDCLGLAATGLSNEQIALRLSISPRTVQNHFDSMRSKLGAVTRQQVLLIAAQMGLLPPRRSTG